MILAGTELTNASEPALRAAAACAKKRDEELSIVHVIEGDAMPRGAAEMRLEQEAAELRRDFDIAVDAKALQGVPEECLLELAASRAPSLLVVGAVGAKKSRRLGSVAERLCQAVDVPVLVVRDASGFEAWASGKRRLRALLGCGMGQASRAALSSLAAWPDAAIVVAHVAWPYGEHYRLGAGQPMPLDHLRPEVHRRLRDDLARWVSETAGPQTFELSVTPGWGRVDAHLAQLASQHEPDLLVLGNHQRNLAARAWHGSISRNAIHEASCSVLCVPERLAKPRVGASPCTIVVPTDFSALADRAIATGYGLLDRGGVLYLVHVVGDLAKADAAQLLAQLKARIPKDAEARGLHSEVRVLEGSSAWLAIWQHANRVGSDLICMGTHSREGAAAVLLGSQARAILQHSRIPVVLVPPDREGS